jgi:hypothetical protein
MSLDLSSNSLVVPTGPKIVLAGILPIDEDRLEPAIKGVLTNAKIRRVKQRDCRRVRRQMYAGALRRDPAACLSRRRWSASQRDGLRRMVSSIETRADQRAAVLTVGVDDPPEPPLSALLRFSLSGTGSRFEVIRCLRASAPVPRRRCCNNRPPWRKSAKP